MEAAPELPPNWRSARAADGKEYYFNQLTGETSWTIPTAKEPAESPAPLVSEPLDDDDDSPEKPSGSSDATYAAENGGGGQTVTGGADEMPDLQVAGMNPGKSYAESIGPGGYKLVIVLVSSLVVMVESAILVGKLKKANEDAAKATTVDLAQAGNVTDAEVLADCSAAGSMGNLALELLEGGISADYDNCTYGVIVSSVSFSLTLLFMVIAKKRPAVLAGFGLPLPSGQGVLSAQQFFYGFLLLWWGPGTGVLTFHGPYRTTGNPYFACWAALLSSTMLCADSFTKMKVGVQTLKGASSSYLREMFGLLVASITLGFASLDFVAHQTGAYGLSLGVISTAISIFVTYLIDTKKIGVGARKIVAAVLFILWGVATLVLTFDSPFTSTGNGYFACWFGLVCATLFAYREFFEMQVKYIDGRFQSFSTRPTELPIVAESLP